MKNISITGIKYHLQNTVFFLFIRKRINKLHYFHTFISTTGIRAGVQKILNCFFYHRLLHVLQCIETAIFRLTVACNGYRFMLKKTKDDLALFADYFTFIFFIFGWHVEAPYSSELDTAFK